MSDEHSLVTRRWSRLLGNVLRNALKMGKKMPRFLGQRSNINHFWKSAKRMKEFGNFVGSFRCTFPSFGKAENEFHFFLFNFCIWSEILWFQNALMLFQLLSSLLRNTTVFFSSTKTKESHFQVFFRAWIRGWVRVWLRVQLENLRVGVWMRVL